MRVVSGSARGIKLTAPEGNMTRPTADKVKEAVFGRIQFKIAEANVLDIFAGSGALGIEALSRGAKSAVFIEKSRSVSGNIKKNLEITRLVGKATVMECDWKVGLNNLRDIKFRFIFLDPPYASGVYGNVAQEIKRLKLLEDGGTLIAEHDGHFTACDGFSLVKIKKYGQTYISYFEEAGNEGDLPGKF